MSTIPTPEKAEYPDCFYAAVVQVNDIISPVDAAVPKTIIVLFDAFREYKPVPGNTFKTGEKILANIVPFDLCNEKIRSTRQVDEANRFDLEVYYVVSCRKVDGMPSVSLSPGQRTWQFPKICVFPINPPQIPETATAKKARLKEDLLQLNREKERLNSLNDRNLAEINARLARELRSEYNVQYAGKSYQNRIISGNLITLPADFRISGRMLDYKIQGIIDLKNYLQFHNVDMILVNTPDLYEVAFNLYFPEYSGLAAAKRLSWLDALARNGIEFVDETEKITEHIRQSRGDLYFYYPYDVHPAAKTIEILADSVAKRLAGYHLSSGDAEIVDPADFQEFKKEKNITAHVNGAARWISATDYCYLYRKNELPFSSKGSYLLAGNSFMILNQFYYKEAKPNFAVAAMSMKTGVKPAYLFMNGSNISWIPSYILRNEKEWLHNKKVLILWGIGWQSIRTFAVSREEILTLSALSETLQKASDIPVHGITYSGASSKTHPFRPGEIKTFHLLGSPKVLHENCLRHSNAAGQDVYWILINKKENSIEFSLPEAVASEGKDKKIILEFTLYATPSNSRIQFEYNRKLLKTFPLSYLQETIYLPLSIPKGRMKLRIEVSSLDFPEIAAISNVVIHY